jgi:hypothetical protein
MNVLVMKLHKAVMVPAEVQLVIIQNFVYRICRCSNATIQRLLTGTKHYQNGIIMYLPESQDNCGSGGMLFTATRAQMAPPHRYRQPSVSGSIWSSPGAYGRLKY